MTIKLVNSKFKNALYVNGILYQESKDIGINDIIDAINELIPMQQSIHFEEWECKEKMKSYPFYLKELKGKLINY